MSKIVISPFKGARLKKLLYAENKLLHYEYWVVKCHKPSLSCDLRKAFDNTKRDV
jgi:hypothetical protein